MTINARSEEYLVGYAVRKEDSDKKKIKKLLTHLVDLENYINTDIVITNIKQALLIQIKGVS
jgi:hypothetical protein